MNINKMMMIISDRQQIFLTGKYLVSPKTRSYSWKFGIDLPSTSTNMRNPPAVPALALLMPRRGLDRELREYTAEEFFAGVDFLLDFHQSFLLEEGGTELDDIPQVILQELKAFF